MLRFYEGGPVIRVTNNIIHWLRETNISHTGTMSTNVTNTGAISTRHIQLFNVGRMWCSSVCTTMCNVSTREYHQTWWSHSMKAISTFLALCVGKLAVREESNSGLCYFLRWHSGQNLWKQPRSQDAHVTTLMVQVVINLYRKSLAHHVFRFIRPISHNGYHIC